MPEFMVSAAVRYLICLFALAAWTMPSVAEVAGEVSGARALNVRAGPGTEHEVRGRLQRGAAVTVLATEGDWASIRLPDGTTGYVHRSFLRLAEGASWAQLGAVTRSPTPSPTATPAEEATKLPAAGQADGVSPATGVSTGVAAAGAAPAGGGRKCAEICGGLKDDLDRLLRITGEMRAEVAAGRVGLAPEASSVDFGEPPGAGPILSIVAVGAVFGFLIGTLYGRRQERNRRTRVRL